MIIIQKNRGSSKNYNYSESPNHAQILEQRRERLRKDLPPVYGEG